MTHDNGVYIVGNRYINSIFIKLNLFCQNSNTKTELFNESKVKYPKLNYSFILYQESEIHNMYYEN